MLTQRHMRRHKLSRADYGSIVVAQRTWAEGNPNAADPKPTFARRVSARPMVADPLGRYDCVPVVSAASAVVVSSSVAGRGVRVRGLVARHGAIDEERRVAHRARRRRRPEDAGWGPSRSASRRFQGHYPVMVLVQLADQGRPDGRDVGALAARIAHREFPVNTGGVNSRAGRQALPAACSDSWRWCAN